MMDFGWTNIFITKKGAYPCNENGNPYSVTLKGAQMALYRNDVSAFKYISRHLCVFMRGWMEPHRLSDEAKSFYYEQIEN